MQLINFWPMRFGLLILSGAIARQIAVDTGGFANGPIVCLFRLTTGHPCPGCGLTRSVGNILLGDFSEALKLNPLGFIFAFSIVSLALKPRITREITRRFALRFNHFSSPVRLVSVMVLISGAWIATVLRSNSGIV